MESAKQRPNVAKQYLAATMDDDCSTTVLIYASSENIGCIKLRRAAVLSLPAGCVLQTWQRKEITSTLENRKEEIPCFLGEIPIETEYRENLWKVIKLCKAAGIDCFVYPPGRYPNKDEDLAHFKRVMTGKSLSTRDL